MKYLITCLLLAPFLSYSQAGIQQTVLTDSVYLQSTVVDSVTYYRQCRFITYEGGGFSHNCSPDLIDSTTLVRRGFRDAHQVMRPVAAAQKIITIVGQYRKSFTDASSLLESITGRSYFDISQDRYAGNLENKAFRIKRIGEDTVLNSLYVIRNQVGNVFIREATITLDNQTKTFTRQITQGGFSSRLQIFDIDHIRMRNLDGNSFVDFVRFPVVDDDGRENGRFVWRDLERKYVLTQFEHEEE